MSENKEEFLQFLMRRARVDRITRIIGIYFLLDHGEVVYVGKSTNIHGRIHTHVIENVKAFDSWAFLDFEEDLLADMEERYVRLLQPRYNVTYNPKGLRKERPKKIRFYEFNGQLFEDVEVTDEMRMRATNRLDAILRRRDQCTENARIR